MNDRLRHSLDILRQTVRVWRWRSPYGAGKAMRLESLDRIHYPNLSIRIMRSMLDELGIDPAPALRAASVSPAQIDDPNGRISGRQELDFQHAYVALTGPAPEVWFRTGLRYRMLSYGAYGFAMMAARTLRRALEFSSGFSDLNYSLMTYAVIVEDGRVTGVGMDPSPIPEALREFSMYRALGSVTTMLNDIWQGRFPLSRIEVTLPAPAAPEVFARALRTPVVFAAARNAWVWPAELEDVALPMSNAVCEETYARQCAEIVARRPTEDPLVRRCLDALVRAGGRYPNPEALAQSLSMSERTLQRRLTERGASYRALLDQVRFQHAQELLQTTTMGLEQIAETLGYSELAAFTHAFTRWSGDSPSAFRRGAHPA
jgi:AraC-like DNA-binding protein